MAAVRQPRSLHQKGGAGYEKNINEWAFVYN